MNTATEFGKKYEIVRLWMTSQENSGRQGNRFTLSEEVLAKSRILMESSEMSRILQALNPGGWTQGTSGYPFTRDLLVLDVGMGTTYGELMQKSGGVIYLNKVAYKVFLCSDGHARAKKVFFVRKAIWDTATRLLCCVRDWQGKYPPSKLRAYLGKAATPSTPLLLDELPRMAVLKDCTRQVKTWASMVRYSIREAGGMSCAENYTVDQPLSREVESNLFDGAGLIDYDTAKRFAGELGLNYVPSVFQIRLSPGVKGCLFTFPLKEFWRECVNGDKPTVIWDVWGTRVEEPENLEIILLESQFKLKKSFDSFAHWEESFRTPNEGYRYTFNISEVSPRRSAMREWIKLSYQPLQTLSLSGEEIAQLAQPTIERITQMHRDPRALCAYMGLDDPAERDNGRGVRPPVFEALAWDRVLLGDDYVMDEVKQQLKRIKEDAYIGKLAVRGCYMYLAPDLVALAEYAFGRKPRGVLEAGECYSHYWNEQAIKEIDVIRFPHLGNEHRVMRCVSGTRAAKWFRYQESSLVLNVHDTTARILGGADFDGDKALTTSDPVLLAAAKREPSVTVLYEPWEEMPAKKSGACGPRDIARLLRADCAAMNCDVGTPTNKTTILWSAEKSERRDAYICTMQTVGSLTIDSVKTAVAADMPTEIKKFIDEIEKPYFLRYRRGEKKRGKYTGKQDCTMNRVCEYMEEHLAGLNPNYPAEHFCYQMLMNDPRERDNRGAAYQTVRSQLLKFKEEYFLLTQNLENKSGVWIERQYQGFFWKCRTALRKEFSQHYFRAPDKEHSELDELLDLMIQLYYTDEEMIAAGFRCKKLLWQAFGPEMIARVRQIDKEREWGDYAQTARVVRKRTDRVKREKQESLDKRKFGIRQPIPVYVKTIEDIQKRTKDPALRKILMGLDVLSRTDGAERQPVVFKEKSREELTETAFCTAVGITPRQWRDRWEQLTAGGLIEVSGRAEEPDGMRITVCLTNKIGEVKCKIESKEELKALCGKVAGRSRK